MMTSLVHYTMVALPILLLREEVDVLGEVDALLLLLLLFPDPIKPLNLQQKTTPLSFNITVNSCTACYCVYIWEVPINYGN